MGEWRFADAIVTENDSNSSTVVPADFHRRRGTGGESRSCFRRRFRRLRSSSHAHHALAFADCLRFDVSTFHAVLRKLIIQDSTFVRFDDTHERTCSDLPHWCAFFILKRDLERGISFLHEICASRKQVNRGQSSTATVAFLANLSESPGPR